MSFDTKKIKEGPWQLIRDNPEAVKRGARMISTREFNKELEKQVKFEKECMVGKGGVSPRLFVLTYRENPKDKRQALFCPLIVGEEFDDSVNRRKLMFGIGVKMHKEKIQPVAIFLTCEAWVGAMSKKYPKDTPLSERDPKDRFEAMIVTGMAVDGRTNMATTPFEKVGKKKKQIMPKTTQFEKFSKSDKKTNIRSFILEEFFKGFTLAMMKAKLGQLPDHLEKDLEEATKNVGSTPIE